MTDETRRGSSAITDGQWERFLDHLEATGNVRGACRTAGIYATKTAYRRRDVDTDFAEAWEAAMCDYRDVIREEMHRRAITGYWKPVVSMGKLVIGEDKKILQEWVGSDAALLRLHQTNTPEGAPKSAAPAPPPEIPADLMPDPVPVGDETPPENPIL